MTKLNELTSDNNPYDKDGAIDWLLQTLIKHGGQTNLYPLHGTNSPQSNDIIWAQDLLASQGYIRRVPNAIGLTFAITPDGEKHFYKRVYDKVVVRLAKSNDFVKVSSILSDLKIEDKNNELSDAIQAKLIAQDKVFTTEEGGIMLKPSAKDELLQTKFQLHENKEQAAVHNDHSIKVGGDYIHAPDNTGQVINKSRLANSTVSQQTNPAPKKLKPKKWYEKLWDKMQEPLFKIVAGFIIAFISGLLTCKWHNQSDSQEQQETTKSTNQDTLSHSSKTFLKSDTKHTSK